MANYLDEYLISLGFEVSVPQLRQFESVIKDARHLVEGETTTMVKTLLKWQASIVTMFGAIATATVGIADKVAMADQEFRLFSMQMYMSEAAGKRLKTTMDALGASLEQITWDPELNKHANFLEEQQLIGQKGLGADFEENMIKIRKLRGEFADLQVAGSYVIAKLVSDLTRAFGPQIDFAIKKLNEFVKYIFSHLPEISEKIQKYLVPVLNDAWDVLKETGEALRELIVLFQNLVGLLSGDDSLQGTEASFDKTAKAIQHVVHWLAEFVHAMTDAEKVVVHLANALILLLSGHLTEAAAEFKASIASLGSGAGGVLGGIAGAGVGGLAGGALGGTAGTWVGGLLGSAFGPIGTVVGAALGGAVTTTLGAALGGAAGVGVGRAIGGANSAYQGGQYGGPLMNGDIAKQALALSQQVGAAVGVDPRIIFEQWAHETGNFSNRGAKELNNLAGITKGGADHGYQNFASLQEFGQYYANLIGKHYNVAGAQTPEQFAAALKRGGYYEDSYSNYVQGMKSFSGLYDKTAGEISVGTIQINIQRPGATKEEVHAAVKTGVRDGLRRQNQRDLVTLPAYG